MGDTMSKLRDMEEDSRVRENITVTVHGQTSVAQDPQFDLYFAAAITGVLAHRRSDSHSNEELVERAHGVATLAVKKRRG